MPIDDLIQKLTEIRAKHPNDDVQVWTFDMDDEECRVSEVFIVESPFIVQVNIS